MTNTGLTLSQLRILELKACGHTDRQVARQIGLSAYTVREHLCNIRRMLVVPNTIAAIVVAIRDGDIDPNKLAIMKREANDPA